MSSRYPQSPASQEPEGWRDPDAPYSRRGAEPVHPEPVEQFFASQDVSRRSRARRPSKARQRRRQRRTVILLVVLLVFAGVVFGVAMMLRDLLGLNDVKDYPGPGTGEVVFTVAEGAGPLAIADALESEDIVADSGEFIAALEGVLDGREVQPGEYEMRYQMASDDAAAILVGDESAKVSYAAVARDLRQGEVFTILAESTGIPVAEFQALAKEPARFGLPDQARSLEGYLHPGEYRFKVEATAPEIVQEMVDNTFAQLEEDGITDPAEQYRILTIASIIQAEAGEADYASVAGSIMNRLKPDNTETSGLIQSDATVTYGLGRKSYDITPEEKADTSNPYNTYANPGLPVGPIGSPSEEAIDAAVSPAEVPFYYWVTVDLDSGETKFSETLAEHAKYVAEYQAWCADNPGRCE
ncbi:endolytic transglycosylase MltG [Arthrobacter crusticola]|uniref:Endolytic murein transglycosylase n=1 Tax=Arthrobacter crusticola TaxID=2547960 RepID=A0A4R5U2G6_9MICC|nr:endolytic transglycosylase MltG [Arthrobacter crusticola]TDK27849.1 endolytic transglycosylase MltG [Arthrobacter crusticola]